MNKVNKSYLIPGVLTLIGVIGSLGVGICSAGIPDLARPSVTLYSPKATANDDVSIGGWGSGRCEATSSVSYNGGGTLQVTSGDLYTGGRIDLKNPVDLTTVMNDPEAYLELAVKFGPSVTKPAQPTPPPAPGAFGPAAGGFRGGRRGEEGPATPVDGGQLPDATGTANQKARNIRVLLVLDNGQSLACQTEIAAYKKGTDGWMDISMPLSVFKGKLQLPAYKVKRIVIGADGTDAVFVGDIQTFDDLTPLRALPGVDKQISLNDPVIFNGSFSAGSTGVRLSWDFDAADGVQEEAVGPAVRHTFKKTGTFTVTLTVTDIFGIKPPATATMKVVVRP